MAEKTRFAVRLQLLEHFRHRPCDGKPFVHFPKLVDAETYEENDEIAIYYGQPSFDR